MVPSARLAHSSIISSVRPNMPTFSSSRANRSISGVDHHLARTSHLIMQLLHVVVIPLFAGLAHFSGAGARSLGGVDLSTIQLSHRALDPRQSSGPLTVPAQCKSMCDPVNSFIAGNVSGCKYWPPCLIAESTTSCPRRAKYPNAAHLRSKRRTSIALNVLPVLPTSRTIPYHKEWSIVSV